jgi:hypothetical protein
MRPSATRAQECRGKTEGAVKGEGVFLPPIAQSWCRSTKVLCDHRQPEHRNAGAFRPSVKRECVLRSNISQSQFRRIGAILVQEHPCSIAQHTFRWYPVSAKQFPEISEATQRIPVRCSGDRERKVIQLSINDNWYPVQVDILRYNWMKEY